MTSQNDILTDTTEHYEPYNINDYSFDNCHNLDDTNVDNLVGPSQNNENQQSNDILSMSDVCEVKQGDVDNLEYQTVEEMMNEKEREKKSKKELEEEEREKMQ